jgi:ABC-2 type transport system permease protein
VLNAVAQQAAAWASTNAQDPAALAELRSPQAKKAPANLLTTIIGPIMGGMLIFFAFFTGGSTSQTLLKEHEEGTLARLFTTPTRLSSILGGKFIAVGLTVLVQVTVLLAAAFLIFGIQWGDLPSVALTALGIVACATSFGIFLTSLVKSTRQSGIIYGGLMTVTGMLGMMRVFTGAQPGGSTPFDAVSLLMPQGWAVRGLLLGIRGAGVGDAALNLLVLLGWSLVFFIIGLLRFQKRFA